MHITYTPHLHISRGTGPIHCSSLSKGNTSSRPPETREAIRSRRGQCRSRQPPRAGGLTYAVAHTPLPRRPARGRPGWQAGQAGSGQLCRALGGVAGVLIQGVPGQGEDLTLARILHAPSPPCTSRQPRPLDLADLDSHSCCHSKGGTSFCTSARGREQQLQQQHTGPGHPDNDNNNTNTSSDTNSNPPPQPNRFPTNPISVVSSLQRSTLVWPGRAFLHRASKVERQRTSWAHTPHFWPPGAPICESTQTASHEPFADRSAAGTERLAIDSFSFSASSL